jgi:predicted nuclease of predicted toxin-antitoxin system
LTPNRPLRIAANENVPGPAVFALRAAGHDVTWIMEQSRGLDDPDILERARAEGRIIVTFDKDFGELVFRKGSAASAGVILFRIDTQSPEEAAERMVRELASHADEFAGHFTVVSDKKVRVVKLPPSP